VRGASRCGPRTSGSAHRSVVRISLALTKYRFRTGRARHPGPQPKGTGVAPALGRSHCRLSAMLEQVPPFAVWNVRNVELILVKVKLAGLGRMHAADSGPVTHIRACPHFRGNVHWQPTIQRSAAAREDRTDARGDFP
jgi:hypothetical protein